MHLDFIAEAIEEELNEFEKWWSTRVYPLPVTKPDGTIESKPIQIGLRARRYYSLIFPKEALDVVLNTLNPENCVVSMVDGKGTKKFRTILKLMRKILKLKPIPKADKDKGFLPVRPFKNTRIVGLGIREDKNIVTEKDGSTHEGL
ncbi:MAG: hypothetical protein ACTSQE_14720 [Candidatus Heimdallarchaeaceae archaeon]